MHQGLETLYQVNFNHKNDCNLLTNQLKDMAQAKKKKKAVVIPKVNQMSQKRSAILEDVERMPKFKIRILAKRELLFNTLLNNLMNLRRTKKKMTKKRRRMKTSQRPLRWTTKFYLWIEESQNPKMKQIAKKSKMKVALSWSQSTAYLTRITTALHRLRRIMNKNRYLEL